MRTIKEKHNETVNNRVQQINKSNVWKTKLKNFIEFEFNTETIYFQIAGAYEVLNIERTIYNSRKSKNNLTIAVACLYQK